ncbi:MAG: RHS repeat-associated core domain-containing protein, partial [Acidimicrobiales bacterium]
SVAESPFNRKTDRGNKSLPNPRIFGEEHSCLHLQVSSTVTLAGTAGTPVTASIATTTGWLRIARVGTTVNTYYSTDGVTWVSVQSTTFVSSTLRVSLLMLSNGGIGTVTWSDFGVTGGTVSYPVSGVYTSPVYDAGQSVAWSSITWDAMTPVGTSVLFQVAVSNSATGPFTYVGPDGTSGTYFTLSGTSLPTLSGRYCSYQATLTGGGTATPTLNRVDVLYGGTNPSTEIAYSYDAAGNMVGKVVEQPGISTISETRTVNNLNQITTNTIVNGPNAGVWTYSWDLSGNLTQQQNTSTGDIWMYAWDDDNRLLAVTLPASLGGAVVSYTYDSLGRMLTRMLSTDPGPTTFAWDGMDCIQETSPTGVVTTYNVVNGVLMSFGRSSSGAAYDSAHYDDDYYAGTIVGQPHADAISSIRNITGDAGNVVVTFDTDAYGNPLPSTNTSLLYGGWGYRYVGGLGVRWDSDTGLYYMRQRWYDPTLQQFISRDPLRGYSHVYAYVSSNPSTFTDPRGLWGPGGRGNYLPPPNVPTTTPTGSPLDRYPQLSNDPLFRQWFALLSPKCQNVFRRMVQATTDDYNSYGAPGPVAGAEWLLTLGNYGVPCADRARNLTNRFDSIPGFKECFDSQINYIDGGLHVNVFVETRDQAWWNTPISGTVVFDSYFNFVAFGTKDLFPRTPLPKHFKKCDCQ